MDHHFNLFIDKFIHSLAKTANSCNEQLTAATNSYQLQQTANSCHKQLTAASNNKQLF